VLIVAVETRLIPLALNGDRREGDEQREQEAFQSGPLQSAGR
jgi:hypothetical protein